MSIGTKMRGVGESTYYTKLLRRQLEEVLNDSNYEMEHILGKRKLVVHTDRISDELSDSISTLLESESPKNIEVERYNHHIEVSWRDINKYTECVDAQAVYEADTEVNQWTGTSKEGGRGYQFFDVCSDGAIPFSFDNLKNIYSLSGGYGHNMFDYLVMQRGVKNLHLKLPIIIEWLGINGLEEIILDAPNLIRFYENYSKSLKRLKVNSLKIINLNYAATNSPIECIEGEFPVLQSGKISVANGILNKASVLRICNTVPTWTTGTHELWLGIHVDHQTDEEVLAAIANAEDKGWTLTVQWNGTPSTQTATTYGLRKPPIYAIIGEMERPDGTTERVLAWGHYVTNPEDYQEFSSLEEAREYFGISEES